MSVNQNMHLAEMGGWSNATGSISASEAAVISTGISTIGGGIVNIFENKANNKNSKEIAQGWNDTQITLLGLSNKTQLKIADNANTTNLIAAKIAADAEKNKPATMDSSNIVMIGALSFIIVATVGIFYLGK